MLENANLHQNLHQNMLENVLIFGKNWKNCWKELKRHKLILNTVQDFVNSDVSKRGQIGAFSPGCRPRGRINCSHLKTHFKADI